MPWRLTPFRVHLLSSVISCIVFPLLSERNRTLIAEVHQKTALSQCAGQERAVFSPVWFILYVFLFFSFFLESLWSGAGVVLNSQSKSTRSVNS